VFLGGQRQTAIPMGGIQRSSNFGVFNQGLKWGGMERYGIPPSQSLSHEHTVYERRNERLGNVPFCI